MGRERGSSLGPPGSLEVMWTMAGALDRQVRRAFFRLLRFPGEEGGAVMTEFIIVAPTFLFLVIGTIQYMGIAHADAMLQHANYMACRAGIVHYESIARRWDPVRRGPAGREMADLMARAARHSMGPLDHLLGGYTRLGLDQDSQRRPLPYAPTGVLDLRVHPSLVATAPETPYMPLWLASQTDLDLGLPMPWVGACIQAIHRHARELTVEEAVQHGMDAYATAQPAEATSLDERYGMNWVTLRSNASLDRRRSDQEPIQRHWPVDSAHQVIPLANPTPLVDEALPIALPIQQRLWKHSLADVAP